MFYQMLVPIFQAVGNAVNWVSRIWLSLGLDWLAWLAGFACLGLLLRLVRAYVGTAVDFKAKEEFYREPVRENAHTPTRDVPRRLGSGSFRHAIGNGEYRNKHKSGRRYTWK